MAVNGLRLTRAADLLNSVATAFQSETTIASLRARPPKVWPWLCGRHTPKILPIFQWRQLRGGME